VLAAIALRFLLFSRDNSRDRRDIRRISCRNRKSRTESSFYAARFQVATATSASNAGRYGVVFVFAWIANRQLLSQLSTTITDITMTDLIRG
jgi:hypothetical protein